jgi:hypothetical protein
MSQTYIPGTILCSGFGETLEQVVVLSDGKVATKTFAGKPVTRRDIMSLDDWKILVGSFTEDYIPVATSAATPMAVPEPVPSAATPATETYPIGTFLRWKHPDGATEWYAPNSRTAIVVKDGILQVKEVINGTPIMTDTPGQSYPKVAKKFFSTVAEWKASLPEGGTVTTKAGEDYTTPSIKRKAAKPIEAADDISYIKEIQQRYSVHASLSQDISPMELRETLLATLRNTVEDMKSRLSSPSLSSLRDADAQKVSDLLGRIYDNSLCIKSLARRVSWAHRAIMHRPTEAHLGRFHFKNDYKQRLVGFLKGKEVEICSSMGFIGLAWDQKYTCANKWAKPILGKTFAEVGLDMKEDGKPKLKVYYRRETIEL